MARIPESEIERLKSEVLVERLVEAAGIELRCSGKDVVGRCPFHEDDTASLVVTPAKNLWYCFGCGVGGGPPVLFSRRSRGRLLRSTYKLPPTFDANMCLNTFQHLLTSKSIEALNLPIVRSRSPFVRKS